MFNTSDFTAIERFWAVAEAHYTRDRSLPQRWQLQNNDVLEGLLENIATRLERRHPRYLQAYRPLTTPANPRLVVLAADGSRHKMQKSQDHYTQKMRSVIHK